ncbi:MAG: HD domain-containing phosphohydrolase [Candidatus Sericytochromatia bacterium]|nr:HD domain-containing phosphohydrolase [Candidatus Sericytochromatia bacterium]
MSSPSANLDLRGTRPMARTIWLDAATGPGDAEWAADLPIRRYSGLQGLVGALATSGILVVPVTLLTDVAIRERLRRHVADGGLLIGSGPTTTPATDLLPEDAFWGWLPQEASATQWRIVLRSALAQDQLQQERMAALDARERFGKQLEEVHRIGIALTTERDPETLLALILRKCREVTTADAGSLYLVEPDGQGGRRLRFKLSQNDSMNVAYEEFTVPIDKASIAGAVALTGIPLVIEDVAHLPPGSDFSFDGAWDLKTGYTTHSMLVVPMRDRGGHVVGVVQLINRKRHAEAVLASPEHVRRFVLAFDEGSVTFASSLASQAGVALENARLVKNIEELFEGFVQASVTAIESRDPTTSGHSSRVATLTVNLARMVDETPNGALAPVRFSLMHLRELRYASLLHDFGKVGVREEVLVKAKKLYPWHLEQVRERLAAMRQATRLADARHRLALVLDKGAETYAACCPQMDRDAAEAEARIDRWLALILSANEPTVLEDGNFDLLQKLANQRWTDGEGRERAVLEAGEVRLLSIRRGSLDADERQEIERHVVHTQRFLAQIPWTPELSGIPSIAGAHHERMNGSGYPLGLAGDAIPLQSRMMAIADIHDALTASDRPYKKAVPLEKALDILHDEAGRGHLDRTLLDIFVTARVWEKPDSQI